MLSITLKDITKRYGPVAAVDHVSLEIGGGELFFLLGPSGCGKTTILRVIAGFCEPDEGEVYFGGRPVLSVPAHKRNTGMVFQNYALWPHMDVFENVAYGLRERDVPKEKRTALVGQALCKVRMLDYARRMPNQLSGGQQQRVALARALVIEPGVVLMDEPLSNLDAQLRLEMRHEIRRIHDETGITMLYVTHDQKEALSMADKVAVMSMGRVEQVGEPRRVYRYPANKFVANFIGETNMIPGVLLGADGAIARVETALGGFRARLGPTPPAVGAKVSCMVRPECLLLGRGEENAFKATLVSSVYLGEQEQFVLEAAGLSLRAVMLNPAETAPGPGQVAEVCFAAEDAILLSAEAEEKQP